MLVVVAVYSRHRGDSRGTTRFPTAPGREECTRPLEGDRKLAVPAAALRLPARASPLKARDSPAEARDYRTTLAVRKSSPQMGLATSVDSRCQAAARPREAAKQRYPPDTVTVRPQQETAGYRP